MGSTNFHRIHRLPQTSIDFHKLPQTFADFQRLPQTSTDFHRLPQTSTDFQRKILKTKKSKMSWSISRNHQFGFFSTPGNEGKNQKSLEIFLISYSSYRSKSSKIVYI